jgi:hypothetical protein
MLSEDEIKNVCGKVESCFEKLTDLEAKAVDAPPEVLYHYTSADGLLGIIQSRQIWPTNALYLNDTSELSHATKILAEELEAMPLRLKPNAGTFSMTIPVYSKDLPLDHFISSFCEDKDLLSQWRRCVGRRLCCGFLFGHTLCDGFETREQ